jgi:uncharacterized protein YkwD
MEEESSNPFDRFRAWLNAGGLRTRLVQGGLVSIGLALIGIAATFLVVGMSGNGPDRSSAAPLAVPTEEERDASNDLAVAWGSIQANGYYEVLEYLAEALKPTPTPTPEPTPTPHHEDPAPPPASNPPPTSPPPPPPPPPPSGCSSIGMAGFAAALFSAINNERTSRGIPALAESGCVNYVAQSRSEDMAANNYFSHTSPSGATAFSLLDANNVGYGWAGENLARNNYPDNESVGVAIRDLMNSPGHRDNILSTNYTMIGVGFAQDGAGMKYYTMVFIGPP